MRVTCDCGNDTFHINFKPPLRGFVECIECGETREIGGGHLPDPDAMRNA